MKRLILHIIAAMALLPAAAQNNTISSSRQTEADRIENLDGDRGMLLLSKKNDLIITVVNAKNYTVSPNAEHKGGLYEYRVVIDNADTDTPKLSVSHRGDPMSTDIVQKLKADYMVAYRIEDVTNPIRMEDQTKANDAILDAKLCEVELTSTIQNLNVTCPPELNAKITSRKKPGDNTVTITSVVIPVETITEARQAAERAQAEFSELDKKLTGSGSAGATEEDWNRLDRLEAAKNKADEHLAAIVNISVRAPGTNVLPIDISGMTPRRKMCYAVLPLEKKVFVGECSAMMAEGKRQFGLRNYQEARNSYAAALKAKDVTDEIKPVIERNMADADTCVLYERYANGALRTIAAMKKKGTATQDETVKFMTAAIDFMTVLDNYNPSEFYKSRIGKLHKFVDNITLDMSFTVVEWLSSFSGFSEGSPIGGVQVYAYHGAYPLNEGEALRTQKRFSRKLAESGTQFELMGTTDSGGKATVHINRKKMPKGFVFRPADDYKISYKSMEELMRKATGTYMQKQFRLKVPKD